MDTKIMDTPSILSNDVSIYAIRIMFNDPLKWLALPVKLEKRICSSFDDCVISLYECMFTRIRLRLPFSNFEVAVLKHLRVSPSQLHMGS